MGEEANLIGVNCRPVVVLWKANQAQYQTASVILVVEFLSAA